jgi:hypothetical protein
VKQSIRSWAVGTGIGWTRGSASTAARAFGPEPVKRRKRRTKGSRVDYCTMRSVRAPAGDGEDEDEEVPPEMTRGHDERLS